MHDLLTKAGFTCDTVERPYLPKELQARALRSKLLPFRVSMSFCAKAGVFVPLRCLNDDTIAAEEHRRVRCLLACTFCATPSHRRSIAPMLRIESL